ncbi:MAG: T9SS type A sorting domain-containing protein [Bacteroidetes bacterium]|nr:MAG: T9SS type A sorting domain-containing protein [Bacteroidota bacterium]
MKKLFTLLAGMMTASFCYATHLVGFDGHVTYIDSVSPTEYKYEVQMYMYRDANSSVIQFDSKIDVGLYDFPSKTLETVLRLDLDSEEKVPNRSGLFKRGVYKLEFTRTKKSLFIVQYIRCCKADADNTLSDMGWDLSIYVPAFLAKGMATSRLKGSPILQSKYSDTLKIDTLWSFPWADSLVINYGTFYTGGSESDPIPVPSNTYTVDSSSTLYRPTYNASFPLSTGGLFAVNASNEFRIKSASLGSFHIPINYKVYKNGVLVALYNQVVFYQGLNQNPPTSVQEAKLPISLYPNPTTNSIKLSSSKEDNYDILNAKGQVLQSGALVEGENEINLSKLAPGLYWVQTTQGTQKLSIIR